MTPCEHIADTQIERESNFTTCRINQTSITCRTTTEAETTVCSDNINTTNRKESTNSGHHNLVSCTSLSCSHISLTSTKVKQLHADSHNME